MLQDMILAAVTPFDSTEAVDFESLARLLAFWRQNGVSRFFICGTTGEMLALSVDERKKIAEFYIKQKKNSEHICIHIGASRPNEVIELGRHAHQMGADSVSIVTPSYFRVNQDDIKYYYSSIIKSLPSDLRIYLYNIPQLTGNDIQASTFAHLANQYSNIDGLKYSFFDIHRTQEYIFAAPERCKILSGTDHMAAALSMVGAHGTVTGAASVYPEIFVKYLTAVKNNDKALCLKLQELVTEIVVLLAYGNIAIFKELLQRRGLSSALCRRPFSPLGSAQKEALISAVERWEEKSSSFCPLIHI